MNQKIAFPILLVLALIMGYQIAPENTVVEYKSDLKRCNMDPHGTTTVPCIQDFTTYAFGVKEISVLAEKKRCSDWGRVFTYFEDRNGAGHISCQKTNLETLFEI